MQGTAITTLSECEWSVSERYFLTSESSICKRDLSYNEYRKTLHDSCGALLANLSLEG